jgi:hypothetical protein
VTSADGPGLDELLRHADSRLYLAKRESKRRDELDAAA